MRLLADPGADLVEALESLPDHLQAVFPLKTKHRRLLPRSVAELSSLLTVAREDLPADYMNRPALLGAYLHHFLPWNLLRLGRLLGGLQAMAGLPSDARILDVGAGPMTFALALWLARPELRAGDLQLLANDRSDPVLRVGRDLLTRLAGEDAWTIKVRRDPVRGALRIPGPLDLLVAANVLNEVAPGGGGRRGGDPVTKVEGWLGPRTQAVKEGGLVLLVEPGTRAGGRLLSDLRTRMLAQGWAIEAPCPHAGECPQPGTGRMPWCHFAADAAGAPAWLRDLGAAAELPKERLSLSFLLLRKPVTGVAETGKAPGKRVPVRVMSDPMSIAGGRRGCYGCSARGLLLLEMPDRARWRQGDLLEVAVPAKPRKDRRSGAAIVPVSPGPGA